MLILLFHCLKKRVSQIIFGDIYIPDQLDPVKEIDKCNIYTSTKYDPKRINEFAIAEIDKNRKVISFEECPVNPKGKLARMGASFFPNDLMDVLSNMGDLNGKSLTDVINEYVTADRARVILQDSNWFNVNTYEDLFLASQYRREVVRKLN